MRGGVRVAGEIAQKEAISVERMRVEMANFVDDVGPEVRRRIRDMLADEDRELSLTSLVQVQRVVLDIVKFLDRGEGDYEPPGYTDKELEEFLGEGGTSDEDAYRVASRTAGEPLPRSVRVFCYSTRTSKLGPVFEALRALSLAWRTTLSC